MKAACNPEVRKLQETLSGPLTEKRREVSRQVESTLEEIRDIESLLVGLRRLSASKQQPPCIDGLLADLIPGSIMMEARVPDASRCFVDIGAFDFLVELTLKEAITFLVQRLDLKKRRAALLTEAKVGHEVAFRAMLETLTLVLEQASGADPFMLTD